MLTIFERELDAKNHSIGSYLFIALLLLGVGVGSLIYNINSAVANFEYVLGTISILYVILIPLLTMKTIAEERKQKTDQLLYSLPLSMWEIVLGKYLANLVVLFIPMIFIGIYPLIFAQYGNVCLETCYGSLIAFFLVGAAFIAVGMYISSLTDNLPFSAGITVAVILLNYYLVDLSGYISDEVSAFMANFSLFDRMNNFIYGIFDVTSVVFMLSVAAFFLFLCVETMEKRRYA